MEENTQTNDVNNTADTQTAGDSSSVANQTSDAGTQDNGSQTNENGQNNASDTLADGTETNKQVPFSRLQQEIEKRAAAEERLRMLESQRQQSNQNQNQGQNQNVDPKVAAAKEQLKGLFKELAPELGFVSQADLQRQEAVRQVDSEHTRLASKYSGKDGLPKYDARAVTDFAVNELGMSSAKGLEHAYKIMHEKEIMNARIQKGVQQTRGVASERSNGTGSANTGVSDADLKKAAEGGDKQAINLLIKRRLSKK